MSDDKLAQLHEVLKDPLRQTILLRLGQSSHLSLENLIGSIRTDSEQELINQLNILLSTTVEGEHLLLKQSLPKKPWEVYALTEKGQYVLDKLVNFPELTLDDYKEKQFDYEKATKPKPKWFTLYWISLFVGTIIVLGVVWPVFGHLSLDETAFYLSAGLLIWGLAYYVRVKPPSLIVNRIMYIVLAAGAIGMMGTFASLISLDWGVPPSAFAVIVAGWFIIGGLFGDWIGRKRNYKVASQYIL